MPIVITNAIYNAQNQINPFQVSEMQHFKINISKILTTFKVPNFLNKDNT